MGTKRRRQTRASDSLHHAPQLRMSAAKDRTLRRLLNELLQSAERREQADIIYLAIQLRSVLIEIGHDM